ncbi:MAG: dehydrogenase [Xanthomonas sp.]|nr:dehydrogenase [Xanthomonas sp.]
MRVMVIVKASTDSEAGRTPGTEQLAETGKFNETLVKAGIMLAGEGLHPTSRGACVRFDGKQRTVIDGPFGETKELIAGFWLWQDRNLDEAIEWIKRAPFDGGEEIALRPVFEADDFGDELTPELREQEARHAAQIQSQTQR